MNCPEIFLFNLHEQCQYGLQQLNGKASQSCLNCTHLIKETAEVEDVETSRIVWAAASLGISKQAFDIFNLE